MSLLQLGLLLLMAAGGALIAFDLTRRRSPSAWRVWAAVGLLVVLIVVLQFVLVRR